MKVNRPIKWDENRPQYLSFGLATGLFLAVILINMSFKKPVYTPPFIEEVEGNAVMPATHWPTKKVIVPKAEKVVQQKKAPVVEIKTVKDDIEETEEVIEKPITDQPSTDMLVPEPAPFVEPVIESEPASIETKSMVERMPIFDACALDTEEERRACSDAALLKYIYSKLNYPRIARENQVEGMVIVEFVVDHTGQVGKVKILRGIGAGCDQAVLKVINSLPEWLPGKQNSRPVNVIFRMPVKFELQ